jgi:hypothetical protein
MRENGVGEIRKIAATDDKAIQILEHKQTAWSCSVARAE